MTEKTTAPITPKTMAQQANEILLKNVDMHELVLIIGFNKNGKIHVDTNRPTFEFVNYAVNRAMYNINQLETTNVLQAEMNAEQAVKDAVVENIPVPVDNVIQLKKRGRKPKVIK